MFLGFKSGVGCGIYTTNSKESCEFILDDTQSKIIVVENKQQLDKIISCKQVNSLKKIIQYSGVPENDHNGLVISVSLQFIHSKIQIFIRIL